MLSYTKVVFQKSFDANYYQSSDSPDALSQASKINKDHRKITVPGITQGERVRFPLPRVSDQIIHTHPTVQGMLLS